MTNTLSIGPHSPVRLLISRGPVRARSNWSVGVTAAAMRDADVSSVLVDDNGAIVTERDLTRALAAGLGPNAPVAALAGHDPIRVPGAMTVVAAAGVMLTEEIRHLIVVDDDTVLGVVSVRQVMAILLEALDPAVWVATLRQAVIGHAEIWIG